MKTLTLALASLVLLLPLVTHADSEGFGSLTPQQVAAKLKQKNVYVFDNNDPACHEGAGRAVKFGYKHVFVMPAGIEGWKKANLPVER